MMTDEELDEIRQRCRKAWPAPWKSYVEGRDHWGGDSFILTGEGENRGEDLHISGATNDDQDFIAHARQDIPRLLDEIVRLKKLLKE